MANSILESFDKAFKEKTSSNLAHKEEDENSDSAKEQEKLVQQKRAKKRRRTHGRTNKNKTKRQASQFKVKHKVPKEAVTFSNTPEIRCVEQEFSMKGDNSEAISAETNFFSMKNGDSWNKNCTDHLNPFDFPFCRALIQREPVDTFDLLQFPDRERLRANIQSVSRKYEEEFLREARGSERPCSHGNECEGLQIDTAGHKAFIVREFLLPTEQADYEKSGKFPPERRMCLLCRRYEIARAHTNIRADAKGMRDDGVLQDYCNIVDVEGEYKLEHCVLSSRDCYEGVILPIVLHLRTAYRFREDEHGIRHYDQWRMTYPENKQHFLVEAPSN